LKDLKNLRTDRVIFYEQYLTFFDLFRAFDIRTLARFIGIERSGGFKESFNFNGFNISSFFKDELAGSIIGRNVFEWTLLSAAVEGS